MRYLAIIVLSVVALLRAAGSSAAVESPAPVLAPVHAAASPTDAFDGPLVLVLGGALIALQLRRRQKSLRSPRTLYG